MMEDIAWLVALLAAQNISIPIPTLLVHSVVKFAWAICIIQHQALVFFVEELISPRTRLATQQKCTLFFSILLSTFFIASIWPSFILNHNNHLINWIQFAIHFYIFFVLLLFSMIRVARYINNPMVRLPRLIRQQFKLFIKFIVLPYWISEAIQFFNIVLEPGWMKNGYLTVTISTILFTYGIYYVSRRVVSLRFLNARGNVSTTTNTYNFVIGFKDILEQLSGTNSIAELKHVTQIFFKNAFSIPLVKTTLIMVHNDVEKKKLEEKCVDLFTTEALKRTRVIVYDELAFTHFYNPSEYRAQLLSICESLNADILVPLAENGNCIGIITVERFARAELYHGMEQHYMLLFGRYLSKLITTLTARSLESTLVHKRALTAELHQHHREIVHYKETVRSVTHYAQRSNIGLVSYKSRRFAVLNTAAQTLIGVDLNEHMGHPLSAALRELAQAVIEYGSNQVIHVRNAEGKQLIMHGFAQEDTTVLISVTHSTISDVMRAHGNTLKEPRMWDYLMYLESTESGSMVHKYMPGSSPRLINSKLDILKHILSEQHLLVEVHSDDREAVVDLIQKIGIRSALLSIDLAEYADIGTANNALFGGQLPLIQQAHEGILVIHNAHVMDRIGQTYLREFIQCGYFKTPKGIQTRISMARIICTTPIATGDITLNEASRTELHTLFKDHVLHVLKPNDLTEEECINSIEEYVSCITDYDTRITLAVPRKEMLKIIAQKSESFYQLKELVDETIAKKPFIAYNIDETDEEDELVLQAARMGKNALKDKKIMRHLWEQYRNQNKIATLLKVNRSSVNRRLKEFRLE